MVVYWVDKLVAMMESKLVGGWDRQWVATKVPDWVKSMAEKLDAEMVVC